MRKFELSDLDDILAIERESFGRDAWPKTLFRDFFRRYPDLFLVARQGRRVVGYSITCVGLKTAELASIAVAKRERRSGVARTLLDTTLRELRNAKVKSWWLMVDTDNEGAIHFYESYGFLTTKRVKRYYGAGRDAWRMRMIL